VSDGEPIRQVVFTNKARCRDCYRCVRVCPVKAIRMSDGQAYVVEDRCIGCGGCANVCPPALIRITDEGCRRIIERDLFRCIYCGRCVEVCPEQALTLSPEYQLSTDHKEDLFIRQELEMGTCQRCGRCFDKTIQHPLDKMMKKGFREEGK